METYGNSNINAPVAKLIISFAAKHPLAACAAQKHCSFCPIKRHHNLPHLSKCKHLLRYHAEMFTQVTLKVSSMCLKQYDRIRTTKTCGSPTGLLTLV